MAAVFSGSVLRFAGMCALAFALGGCADRAGFPSLARRPAESASGQPTPAAPPGPVATEASGQTVVKLAQLRQTAAAAHARFVTHRAAAERSAAGAGPLGSDSWAAASVALATLEEAHDQQTAALAEIDQLQAERQLADAGADDPDVAAILAAHDGIATAADADGDVVTRLRARLER